MPGRAERPRCRGRDAGQARRVEHDRRGGVLHALERLGREVRRAVEVQAVLEQGVVLVEGREGDADRGRGARRLLQPRRRGQQPGDLDDAAVAVQRVPDVVLRQVHRNLHGEQRVRPVRPARHDHLPVQPAARRPVEPPPEDRLEVLRVREAEQHARRRLGNAEVAAEGHLVEDARGPLEAQVVGRGQQEGAPCKEPPRYGAFATRIAPAVDAIFRHSRASYVHVRGRAFVGFYTAPQAVGVPLGRGNWAVPAAIN